jgi:hypothetical protein
MRVLFVSLVAAVLGMSPFPGRLILMVQSQQRLLSAG